MIFSERQGYKPAQKKLQIEKVDDELRNRLWNLIDVYYWRNYKVSGVNSSVKRSNFSTFMHQLWHNFFKWKINQIPYHFRDAVDIIEEQFFNFKWFRVYDYLEFIIRITPDRVPDIDQFPAACNEILEQENAGYRIIDGKVTPITSDTEIQTIEEIIANSQSFPGVSTHISTALSLLSDRENPDYRNSIKESISAVESACQVIADDNKATLGDALNKLEKRMHLHGALKSGFKSLYGYTSDEDGIRHAILDEKDISFSDAKYMLVSCSSFTNYLIGKVAELEIEIN